MVGGGFDAFMIPSIKKDCIGGRDKSRYILKSFFLLNILEAKYPVITGFLSQSVGIMQK
jgi:hypothetical protein